jgi:hypothetical protein
MGPVGSSPRVVRAASGHSPLRMLTRYRVHVMGDRTREATPLEGMLEDEVIKLSVVASA